MKITPFVIAAAIFLSASVLLNVSHAKDLLAMQPASGDAAQKQDTTSGALAKIGTDLHPHMDKHFSDSAQVDNRSLRLRDSKKPLPRAFRGWLAAWRNHISLHTS